MTSLKEFSKKMQEVGMIIFRAGVSLTMITLIIIAILILCAMIA